MPRLEWTSLRVDVFEVDNRRPATCKCVESGTCSDLGMCGHALQADYEDLRNRMEPLSDAIQKLQAEKAELAQQLQQVRYCDRSYDRTSWARHHSFSNALGPTSTWPLCVLAACAHALSCNRLNKKDNSTQ
jgi:hypothetical protein